MPRRLPFGISLALLLASPMLFAQAYRTNSDIPDPAPKFHADDESKIDFRSATVLMQVPVTVADKSGRHIEHLTKERFQLFENGREQSIATFEEITADNSQPPIAATPGIFRNLNIQGRPRSVVVIAIDAVNTPFLDQAAARRELVRFIADNLDSKQTMEMVLISHHGLKVVQDLTTDPTALIGALKELGGELPAMQDISANVQSSLWLGTGPGADLGEFVNGAEREYAERKQEVAIETTMRAFLDIAWSLAGVPGRKCLIWATGGFPFNLESPSLLPGGLLSEAYEHAMQALNDAQVSVYPVDVRGLLSGASASNVFLEASKRDILRTFAEMTGGRAFYNTNDLASSFRKAADDSSSYYLLGYYLDTKNTRSGWRRLTVKVREKEAQAFSRSGFLATNVTMNARVNRDSDFAMIVNSPLEATGIPIWMQWESSPGPAGPHTKRVGFALHIPGDRIAVEGDQNAMDLEFIMVVETKAGKILSDPIRHPMKANLSPESLAKVRVQGLKYSSALQLPAGNYDVRFVVRDNVSGKLGSISAPLTVN